MSAFPSGQGGSCSGVDQGQIRQGVSSRREAGFAEVPGPRGARRHLTPRACESQRHREFLVQGKRFRSLGGVPRESTGSAVSRTCGRGWKSAGRDEVHKMEGGTESMRLRFPRRASFPFFFAWNRRKCSDPTSLKPAADANKACNSGQRKNFAVFRFGRAGSGGWVPEARRSRPLRPRGPATRALRRSPPASEVGASYSSVTL